VFVEARLIFTETISSNSMAAKINLMQLLSAQLIGYRVIHLLYWSYWASHIYNEMATLTMIYVRDMEYKAIEMRCGLKSVWW